MKPNRQHASPLKRELITGPTSTDVTVLRASADSFANHARECIKRGKALDECDTCRSIVAWYRALPLPTLALVVEDRPETRARAFSAGRPQSP